MKDLLKEAIADAKAVRETALANAKIALEEAFTPRLQSMLSAKLAEEMSEDEPEMDEDMMEGDDMDNGSDETSEDHSEETHSEEDHAEEEPAAEESEEDDDLDLDEIIAELEMDEELNSSEIGTGDNKMDDYDTSTEDDTDGELYGEGDDEVSMDEDEEIDVNEIINALREEDESEEEMTSEADDSSSEELEEAYNVIKFLKGKINEVNLLNAKLLYSNKLFRNFTLNENQKMKVVENFDRAYSLREVKLVYSTLAEGFKMSSTKKVMKESFASKPVASTKPAKRVISEGTDLASRFQKLAGLIK
jgi:hypothetical protein